MRVCSQCMYIQNDKLNYTKNARKLPVHWTSKIPKQYKRSAIDAELNKAARVASTFI